ncbi:MAG: hypothetical protein QM778_03740 [Myxococcales bacterium]
MTSVVPGGRRGDASRGQGTLSLRYEDVAQDGRLKPIAMPHGMGVVAYRKLWNPTPLASALRERGILPILSRLKMESLGGPVSVLQPVEVQAWYELCHLRGSNGEVQRVLLNLGADLYGSRGRTHDPQPLAGGERIQVGRVFAEHVFTRPFAAPEARRVSGADFEGLDIGAELPTPDGRGSLAPPDASRALDADFVADPADTVFGLGQTDSNQHINSLAYIPLFEATALRRLADHGRATEQFQLREIELTYRKPCFAGDRMRSASRVFQRDTTLLVRALMAPHGASVERAHCTCALTFEPR